MKTSCILIVFLLSVSLEGKTKPVEGRILNEDGNILSDVNIISLPSKTGTKSNNEGQFSLIVPIKDRKLSLNHIGYESDTINIILYENGTDIILKEKVLLMDSLDVTAANRRQFDPFKDKNNVVFIDMEDISLRGSMDLGDAVFSEYPVLLNETIDGKKSISIRASSSEEMVYLYDGIRINNMGDALMDLSQLTTLGLSGMELISGSHEKALSSSGTINFVPKLTYGNSIIFNQQFGTYDYGGYDGFGSIGFKNSTINSGYSQVQMSQAYSDTNEAEINTISNRFYINTGVKNKKSLEIRMMAFQNEKLFQNIRTNDSIDVKMRNLIFKMENSHPLTGKIIFFSLFQDFEGNEKTGIDSRIKNDNTQGLGFEYEKIVENSKFRFSTETHLTETDWNIDNNNIILERQSSIFTGSFEIYQPENDKDFQFKDLKFVFSKHRVTDIPDTSVGNLISDNYWDNNNSQFTASFLKKQPNKRLLMYINLGNVFRVPSVGESIGNQTYPYYIFHNKLLPEQKSMYELGLKINNNKDSDRSYSAVISGFSYYYYGKIKQLYFTGTPIKYPINFGKASIAGLEIYFNYTPKIDWIYFKTYLSNYYFSDPSAFQLQPDKMLRIIITIKNKWFNIEFIQRNESSRHVTTIEENGFEKQTILDPITNFDINIYREFQVGFFKSHFSFSGRNLNSSSQELEGISIYDRRYSLNISIMLK